jgi:hypothetical protein
MRLKRVKVSKEAHQQINEERRQRRAETCQEINEERNQRRAKVFAEEHQLNNEEMRQIRDQLPAEEIQ